VLIDVLLVVLLVLCIGGFGWQAGLYGPRRYDPPGTGYTMPGTVAAGTETPETVAPRQRPWGPPPIGSNPIGLILVVLLVLIVVALVSPWPFHHYWYRW